MATGVPSVVCSARHTPSHTTLPDPLDEAISVRQHLAWAIGEFLHTCKLRQRWRDI